MKFVILFFGFWVGALLIDHNQIYWGVLAMIIGNSVSDKLENDK